MERVVRFKAEARAEGSGKEKYVRTRKEITGVGG